MVRKIKRNEALQFYLTAAFFLLGTATYQAGHITGPVMHPDEFGYWANAAYLLGYDWTGAASLQSYYSFGYSLLLIPLLRLFAGPRALYLAAVLMNVLFVFLHAVLLWKSVRLLNNGEWKYSSFICGMAAFYPSLIFNMQLTWTECLLSLLYMCSIWLFLSYEKTQHRRYGILLACCLIYLYFVHMRSVGVLAAGVLAGGYRLFRQENRPWKQIAGWGLLMITGLAAGAVMKHFLQDGLYSRTAPSLININDYGGQAGRLRLLLTAGGAADFAVSCLGKLFYLGIATCGTAYYGVWHIMKRLKEKCIYLYLLLSAAFTFVLTAFYMMDGERADAFIYGRYNEFLIPMLICLGLYEMSVNKYLWRTAAGIAVAHGGIACMLMQVMAPFEPKLFQGYFTVGISYALREYMPEIEDYILLPYITGTAVMFLLVLVMGVLVRRKPVFHCYLLLFAGLYLYTAVTAGGKYLYDHSVDTGEDMELACWVKERLGGEDGVLFINSDNDSVYVDALQFGLKDIPLKVAGEECIWEPEAERADFVFTYQTNKQEAVLRKYYDSVKETYHFKLYFNKG